MSRKRRFAISLVALLIVAVALPRVVDFLFVIAWMFFWSCSACTGAPQWLDWVDLARQIFPVLGFVAALIAAAYWVLKAPRAGPQED